MGAIRKEDTHVKRSSSMSFALRWKHEKLRLISFIALFSFAMIFMFVMLANSASSKSVSVVIDGQETVVKTKQKVLKNLLDEQQIAVDRHDRVSKPLDSELQDGDKIVIERTVPVQLTADGQTKTVHTTGKTVAGAIRDLNVHLGKDDRVIPAMDATITDNTAIRVIRVKKVVEKKEEHIPYQVVKQSDSGLAKGKQKTIRAGKEGVVVKQIEKTYEDGKLVSASVIGKTVKEQSVNKIIAIGTKKPVVALSASSPSVHKLSLGGVSIPVKRILNNVTLTAYSASEKSTGKSPSHPQFGITASGTKVTEGRTIAVDPGVIPMGWWVYIEGIGFRRAEDKGSAVKGKKIDVYFSSEERAMRFGMKSGYKVYVVGPRKPAVN